MTVQSAPSYPKAFSSLGELTLRQACPALKQASFRALHSEILQLPQVGCSRDKKGDLGCDFPRGAKAGVCVI